MASHMVEWQAEGRKVRHQRLAPLSDGSAATGDRHKATLDLVFAGAAEPKHRRAMVAQPSTAARMMLFQCDGVYRGGCRAPPWKAALPNAKAIPKKIGRSLSLNGIVCRYNYLDLFCTILL
jgi:hypothetical protein